MGELLFPRFFHANDIETDSAGTQGLINSPIDPSSGRLMVHDGIDPSDFRSKRLTSQLSMNSDLILCFTENQRQRIVAQTPRVRTRTFLLSDFANLCRYFKQNKLLREVTIDDRLQEVTNNAPLIRPFIPAAEEISDPYHKDFPAFQVVHDQIGHAIADIASALELPRGEHAA